MAGRTDSMARFAHGDQYFLADVLHFTSRKTALQGARHEWADIFKQSMKGLAISILSERHQVCTAYALVIFHEPPINYWGAWQRKLHAPGPSFVESLN